MRAQFARQLADTPLADSFSTLLPLLSDPSPRARYFSALALGRLGDPRAVGPLATLLRENRDTDVHLRHAAVVALSRLAAGAGRNAFAALARDASVSVRLAALLVERRLGRETVAEFLVDPEPRLVREAVRAIHDLPLVGRLPALAALTERLPEFDDATGRRVLNARYRLGRTEDAAALAGVASRRDVSVVLRREALALLAEWAEPFPRDRVTAQWAPLPKRSADPAIAAIRKVLPGLVQGTPAEVAAAAVGLAGHYRIGTAGRASPAPSGVGA